MPVPDNSYKLVLDTNANSVSVSVNGGNEFAEGGLLIAICSIDSDHLAAAVSASGVAGMTEHFVVTDGTFQTLACYSKELEAGDTSATTFTITWGESQKAVIAVYYWLPNNHGGIVGTPTGVANGNDPTPDIPAMADLPEGENTVFAICGMDSGGGASIVADPTGYTEEYNQAGTISSGTVRLYVATATLGGAQAANTMTLNNSWNNSTGIIAVGEAVAGGGGSAITPRLRMGIGTSF